MAESKEVTSQYLCENGQWNKLNFKQNKNYGTRQKQFHLNQNRKNQYREQKTEYERVSNKDTNNGKVMSEGRKSFETRSYQGRIYEVKQETRHNEIRSHQNRSNERRSFQTRNNEMTTLQPRSHEMTVYKIRTPKTEPQKLRNHEVMLSLQTRPNDVKQHHIRTHEMKPQLLITQEIAQKQVRMQETEDVKRQRKWFEYFIDNPRDFLLYDFHRISRLSTIEQDKPNAQFKCLVCGYYCDTLYVVNSHIEGPKHLKALQNHFHEFTIRTLPPIPSSQIDVINKTLENIVYHHGLTEFECRERKDVAKYINNIVSERFPGCSVRLYGSSAHGMGLKLSDINLNLSVPLDSTLFRPSKVMEEVVDILKEDPTFQDTQEYFDCEFPHVTFMYAKNGVQCNLRLNSDIGVVLAALFRKYAVIDVRVSKLAALARFWAMVSHIANPEEGTLPGYCLYLFVIYYLQQLPIPVLPVLNELYSDVPDERIDTYRLIDIDCADINEKWTTQNTQNIGELWIGFLKFYAVDFKYTDFLICITRSEKLALFNLNRFFLIDPVHENKIRYPNNRSSFIYIISCLKTTYRYFAIPQTIKGPIFGSIKDHPTANECPPLTQYVEGHIAATHQMIKSSSLIGSTYMNTGCVGSDGTRAKVAGFLEAILHPENLYNFKLSDTNSIPDPSKPKEISIILSEKTVVFSEDAAYLVPLVKPERLQYDFSLQRFTNGKPVPYYCGVCKKDGHTKDRCADAMIYRLKPLDPPNPKVFTILNILCQNVYASSILSEEELKVREDVVLELEGKFKEIFKDAKLTLFGSSRNGFYMKGSDLDICLTFSSNEAGEGLDLKACIENLYEALKNKKFEEITDLVAIPTAKVPIIKFKHTQSQLVGDFSMYNTLGQENTKLLKTYADIDKRVVMLGIMMKRFAKECCIGNASKGTLSSYAYTLMVIYFLQRCKTPVLPVLQELSINPGPLPEKIIQGWNTYFFDDLDRLHEIWPGLGKNTQSVGQLWLELLCFYTERFDPTIHVVSIRQRERLSKFGKSWTSRCISIEDPFELTHNLGASISRRMNTYIFQALQKGRNHFSTVPTDNQKSLEDYYFNNNVLTDGEPPPERSSESYNYLSRSMAHCLKWIAENTLRENTLKLIKPGNEKADSGLSSPKNSPVKENALQTEIDKDFVPELNSDSDEEVLQSNRQINQPSIPSPLLIPEQSIPYPHRNMTPFQTAANNASWRFEPSIPPPSMTSMPPPPTLHHITKTEHFLQPSIPLAFGNTKAPINRQYTSETVQKNGGTIQSSMIQLANIRFPIPPGFPILKHAQDNLQKPRPFHANQSKSISNFPLEPRTGFVHGNHHSNYNIPNRIYSSHFQTIPNNEDTTKECTPTMHCENFEYCSLKNNISPTLYTNQKIRSTDSAPVLPENFGNAQSLNNSYIQHPPLQQAQPATSNQSLVVDTAIINSIDREKEKANWTKAMAKLCKSYRESSTEENPVLVPHDNVVFSNTNTNNMITPNMKYVNEVERQTIGQRSNRNVLKEGESYQKSRHGYSKSSTPWRRRNAQGEYENDSDKSE